MDIEVMYVLTGGLLLGLLLMWYADFVYKKVLLNKAEERGVEYIRGEPIVLVKLEDYQKLRRLELKENKIIREDD